MRAPTITTSELIAAIEDAAIHTHAHTLQEPPPGFFTIQQYANHLKIEYEPARKALHRQVQTGKLEQVSVYALDRRGRRWPTAFYGKPRTLDRSGGKGKR